MSSCRHTSRAPAPAASLIPDASAASCSSGSGCQRCCTAPIRSGARRGGRLRAGEAGVAGATIRLISLIADDSRLSLMSATLTSTPAADGYRMPGEFEPHSGCWMAWPERPDNWRLGAKPAQQAYAAVAEAINASEPVTMAVSDAQFEHCRSVLSGLDPRRRDLHRRRVDARHRPDLPRSTRAAADAASTGASTPGAASTAACTSRGTATSASPRKVLEIEGAERYRAPLVLEGGSIHVDGEGTVIGDRRVPAEPQPQSQALARADRAGAVRASRRREDDLARPRRVQRRDRRARRQPRVLRAAGRRAADVER